jgi:predicted Zn-dependent peptidase
MKKQLPNTAQTTRTRTISLTLGITALVALLALPAPAQVKNYQDIKYPKLPEFKIPKPEVFTLPNGLQVFLMEDHELPLIDLTARIRTGANYEPADKVGLARLTGTVQRTGGTPHMTGDQIDDYLAARAASIETGIGRDSGHASMDCLKQDFDDVFRVFVEILREPVFAQDKLDLAKVTENTMIARRNDEVGSITSREATRLVYGPDSPLARNTEYSAIKAVTRDDLVAWHKRFYQPNSVLLGVVGDFDSKEMKQKIEAALGDWPKGPEFVAPPVPYRREPAPGYYFIEKSDVNQANIAFGHLGIETKNPDYFAAQVMNEVLGGGFASRMFSNVRSHKGLAYGVSAYLGSDYYQPGQFRAGLQTKSANLTKAIAAVKAEISGIIENPPDDVEMKRAKDSILNSFVFNYDSKRKVLSQQLTYAFYGLPDDFLEQYRANVEKVTRDDVARVAKKYVHPEQLAILVVGKSADFDQPLTNMGKVTTVDITIPPPPDDTPKAEKSAANLEAGKQLWSKVVKALGGEALKKADVIQIGASVALQAGGQAMSVKQNSTLAFPDKERHVIVTPMGEQILVINGEEGFMKAGDRVVPLPAAAVQEMNRERVRSLEYLLRYNDDPGLQALAAGEESVDGTVCRILAISFKDAESRLWVAPDGKVMKQSYQGQHPFTRAPGTVENTYSDYRSEKTLLLPHQRARHVDGQEVMTITMDSFEVNPALTPELFRKPQIAAPAERTP